MYLYIVIYESIMSTKSNSSKMHRTQLFLPKKLHSLLSKEAQNLNITNSELVRQMVHQYLSKNHRRKTEAGMNLLLEMAEGGS